MYIPPDLYDRLLRQVSDAIEVRTVLTEAGVRAAAKAALEVIATQPACPFHHDPQDGTP